MSRPPKYRGSPYGAKDPENLDNILSELFHLRGYNRFKANEQLQEMWDQVAEEFSHAAMKVKGIKNGVLEITLSNSALLYQLDSFYKSEFLHTIQTEYKHLKVREIKFRLKGNLNK
ncbi:DciA family protein [Thalassoglobus sp.]|uniref:DciA family protein n=1 Tax=Thalassoglobus sp. TaxID=2795869 RepID=UPI003AA9B52B